MGGRAPPGAGLSLWAGRLLGVGSIEQVKTLLRAQAGPLTGTPVSPELLSAADVADVLDVSRQRVHQLATSHPRFPEPYVRLATGPIWTLPVIEHFRDTWDRRPGRRRVVAVG